MGVECFFQLWYYNSGEDNEKRGNFKAVSKNLNNYFAVNLVTPHTGGVMVDVEMPLPAAFLLRNKRQLPFEL